MFYDWLMWNVFISKRKNELVISIQKEILDLSVSFYYPLPFGFWYQPMAQILFLSNNTKTNTNTY